MGLQFGFEGQKSAAAAQETKVDVNTGEETKVDNNGEEVSTLDNNGNPGEQTPPADNNGEGGNNGDDNLEVGTVVTLGEDNYTVNEKGDLVDKDGNIFKEAKDVKAFLDEYEVSEKDETPVFDINGMIETVGTKITDEDGKDVIFENTPQGAAAYVNEVLELKKEEFAKAGVEALIEKYPIVNDFLNYYIANGNSYEGFGQNKDRSSIVIDENNEAQQEAIIREAWKESKRAGNVDAYIKYLKDSNQLKDVAQSELEGLQEYDKRIKEQIAKEAQERIIKEQQEQEQYWGMVKEIIDNKQIAGYKLPEVIMLNRDGKQVTASLNDFYNYVYQVDDKGISRYEYSLMNKTPKERCERQLLEAYLDFTGNDYTSLINLAMAEEKKKQLVLTSANRKTKVTITKPKREESKTAASTANKIAGSY